MGTKREAHGTMSVEKQEEKKEKKRIASFFFVDANLIADICLREFVHFVKLHGE